MVMKYTKKIFLLCFLLIILLSGCGKITLEKLHTSIYNKNRCC